MRSTRLRRCLEAQPFFESAVELFAKAGMDAEVGRTMVGQMDNLSFLSRFEDAVRLEQRARSTLGESRRSALPHRTLDIALGNLYYRLNRYDESLRRYDSALTKAITRF
jgi:tetratricopeptide (TPR) repeat protein